MGATVVILGPTALATELANQTMERVITDGRGRFMIEHLVPGWYSLKVSAPTRLPAMRNGVRVEAGETVIARFVLADIFAPVRFQLPNNSVSTWGDDWKWVLRTSSTTRPILRYHEQKQTVQAASNEEKPTLPSSQWLSGVLPGSTLRDPLANDPGMASMVAYLRPLSEESDLLVAGSFSPSSASAGTVATVFRRDLMKGEPQEFGVIVHQFSLGTAAPLPPGGSPDARLRARGMVLTMSQTRLIAPKVTVTAGMDVNYLSSLENVLTAQPRMNLEYQATPATVVAVQYGSARAEGANTLLEQVGLLDSFPRLTERDYRLKLEQLNHSEVSVNRRFGKSNRVQAAAYHDSVRNGAVWGLGQAGSALGLAGNCLPNLAGNGFLANVGDYQSAGFRAVYSRNFGAHVEALAAYATGDALLATHAFVIPGSGADLEGVLRPQRTTSVTGKISMEIPLTHTRVVTSYEWVPNNRISLVDPYGQASLQIQPYAGIQIRQPLPTFSFLPAHIEATADFRNLAAQGYVLGSELAQKPIVLSSGYRCVRGGLSVQF